MRTKGKIPWQEASPHESLHSLPKRSNHSRVTRDQRPVRIWTNDLRINDLWINDLRINDLRINDLWINDSGCFQQSAGGRRRIQRRCRKLQP